MTDGRHLTLIVLDEDIVQRLRVQTVFWRSLHHNAVELGEAHEVRGIVTADITAQGCEHITGRHTTTLAEGCIHLHTVLRIFQREVGVGTTNLRALTERCNQLVRIAQQVLYVATVLVLHVQLETVDASETWQHVLRVHLNLGICDVGGTTIDFLHDALVIVAFTLTLVPFLQFQREVTVRR